MEKNNENENVSVEPPKNQEGKYVIDKDNPAHIRWLYQQQANRGAKAVNQGKEEFLNTAAELSTPVVAGLAIANPVSTALGLTGGTVGSLLGMSIAPRKYREEAAVIGGTLGSLAVPGVKLFQSKNKIKTINKELNNLIDENSIIESYNKIPQNKDVGTAYDYLHYLDNIFPNSKLNGLFFHGGPKGIRRFKTPKEVKIEGIGLNKNINTGTEDYGIYLVPKKQLAQRYADTHKKNGYTYTMKVNSENPALFESPSKLLESVRGTGDFAFSPASISQKWYDRLGLKRFDAIYHRSKNALADEELIVFNPDDIHIMGTPQDTELFKQWAKHKIINNNISFKPSYETIPVSYDPTIKNILKAYAIPMIGFGSLFGLGGLAAHEHFKTQKRIKERKKQKTNNKTL